MFRVLPTVVEGIGVVCESGRADIEPSFVALHSVKIGMGSVSPLRSVLRAPT